MTYQTERLDRPEQRFLGLTLSAWLMIGTVAALMAVTYWPNLRRLYLKVNPFTGEPNWSHSVVIPIVGLYYLYLNREALFRAKVQALLPTHFTRGRLLGAVGFLIAGALCYFVAPKLVPAQAGSLEWLGLGTSFWGLLGLLLNWGLGTLIFGLLTSAFGIWPGRNDFLWDMGMVITLFGAVLMICGWEVMKIAWFPIVFLICAIPWPGLVYSKVAGPLQQLAAEIAVGTLQITGVDADRVGTKIYIGSPFAGNVRTLNVAEACAGMRSLMTFISVGAAVAFLSGRPMWQKLIITLSAVPIAIFCNVMRVTGTGLLDHYWSQEMSEGFSHQFVGMVMLIPAFFMILGVAWILDQVFVEEVETAPVIVRKPTGGVIRAPRRAAPGTDAEVPS